MERKAERGKRGVAESMLAKRKVDTLFYPDPCFCLKASILAEEENVISLGSNFKIENRSTTLDETYILIIISAFFIFK